MTQHNGTVGTVGSNGTGHGVNVPVGLGHPVGLTQVAEQHGIDWRLVGGRLEVQESWSQLVGDQWEWCEEWVPCPDTLQGLLRWLGY